VEAIELKVKKRERSGKSLTKKVRAEGDIPAIIYGGTKPTVAIQVNSKEFQTAIHSKAGENTLLQLNFEGTKTKTTETVLIKDVQHDPVSEDVLHIDFTIVSLTEKIRAKVSIHEKGEALGVKEGGVIDIPHHEVEVECLPTDIPDRIVIDVSALDINDAVHVKELNIPSGVQCLLDPEEVVLKVLPPRKEEEAPAEEVAEEVTEPEVITEKKVEEREAKEEAPAKEKPEKEKPAS